MDKKQNTIKSFFEKKLLAPLVSFLKQGLSPEKLALCVAFGIALGTFPMLGATTLLCTAAALLLRLNMPAIQLVNYFMYPVQLALFIPFIKAGEILFNQPPIPLDLLQIFAMLQTDIFGAIQSLWWTNVRGMVVWGLTIPPISFAVYFLLVKLFKRLAIQMVQK